MPRMPGLLRQPGGLSHDAVPVPKGAGGRQNGRQFGLKFRQGLREDCQVLCGSRRNTISQTGKDLA